MPFWRPGAPRPPLRTDLLDLDADAEKHWTALAFNPDSELPLQQQRQRLPIHRHRLQLLHALETHGTVVLSGPTGCGKSTQVPQYLDEAGWTSAGYAVAVTLPRRLAAVTVAARVAHEMGVELGEDVGYKIRFDSCVAPERTRVFFMTDGLLLREMLSDPLLTRYGVIMIDEAHERSVHTDMLLGLLKKITRKRPQLRLIVSSATVDVEAFLRFFSRGTKSATSASVPLPHRKRPRCGWDDEAGEFHRQREEDADWRQLCKDLGGEGTLPQADVCFLAVEGTLHPVKIHFLREPVADYLEAAVQAVVNIHRHSPHGDILIFLTGREEIEAVCTLIRERWQESFERSRRQRNQPALFLETIPLWGAMSNDDQIKALRPGARGTRKVIVSTNVAEASVTIEGIVYVIDVCLAKMPAFCPHNGASYLNIVPCSRSAARQRAGRAGRVQPGHCFRLLTETAFTSSLMMEHTIPEIARADLKGPVLMMKCFGVDDVGAFQFMTPPCRDAIELALEQLYALGAIDSDARIIEPIGPRLVHGPLPVELMRLLLLSTEPPHSCAAEAAVVCAMLSLRAPWLPSRNSERLHACKQSFAVHEGDVVTLLNVFRQFEVNRDDDIGWAERHLLNCKLLARAAQVQLQLVEHLKRLQLPVESCDAEVQRLQRLMCAALFLNAARRLPSGAYKLCRPVSEARAPDLHFQLHSGSVYASIVHDEALANFVIFIESVCTGTQASLVHNTSIKPEWLPELAPHYYQEVAVGRAVQDL